MYWNINNPENLFIRHPVSIKYKYEVTNQETIKFW